MATVCTVCSTDNVTSASLSASHATALLDSHYYRIDYSGMLLRPSLQTQMAPGAQVIIKALPPRL